MQITDFLFRREFREIRRELFKKDSPPLEQLLTQPYYEEANKILIKEMGMSAGYELLLKIQEVFEDKNKAKNWFYSEILALNNKRPYDYCRSNQRQIIYDELNRIEHGICC